MTMICRKLCSGAGRDAVANDQRKQVSADNPQHAADGGPNQTLQADPAQLPFEQHDDRANPSSNRRVLLGRQAEWINQVASNPNYKNKENPNQY